MPGPALTSQQQAEVREFALTARADTTFRGRGSVRGAVGRNATQVVRDEIARRYGVELGVRAVQKLLGRLGLVYRHAAQGGLWIEG